MKVLVFLGITIGSGVGGLLPMLWGDSDLLSPMSALCSILGGGLGLLIAVKIAQLFEV